MSTAACEVSEKGKTVEKPWGFAEGRRVESDKPMTLTLPDR